MPLKIDILNETFECPVCGHRNHISATVCEKCQTKFPEKKPLGGNMNLSVEVKEPTEKRNVRKLIRSLPDNYRKDKKVKSREEVIAEFQMVPGITKEVAERVYNAGIHTLSDLIYSMLSNQGVKGSERTAIVYEEYIVVRKSGSNTITCPFCKTHIDISLDRCPVCDASMKDEILRIDLKKVTDELEKFIDDVIRESETLEEEEKPAIEEKKEPETVQSKEPSTPAQVKEEPKPKLSLDELEELDETKPKKQIVELDVLQETKTEEQKVEQKKIELDISEIEVVEKEEGTKKALDEILGGIIEEEKKPEETPKPAISNEKYQEYRKRIDDWKAEGYDVTEVEKILLEKPEQFEELSKKIIIEQFKKKRAALKKTVKK